MSPEELKERVSLLIDELASADTNSLRDIVHELVGELEGTPLIEFKPNRDVIFVGDLHGDFESLLALKNVADGSALVFLGDYVDRGLSQLECLLGALLIKLERPHEVVMLRGNHETPSMNAYYGFMSELARRFPDRWKDIYKRLVTEIYSKLPLAAIISLPRGRIFSCHGGPPITRDLEDLRKVKLEVEPEDEVAIEVLWSDPREGLRGYVYSPRGAGYLYGRDVVESFIEKYGFRFIVRAHEPVNGVLRMFDGSLYVVFTCRYYGIQPSVLWVNKDLDIKVIRLL